MIRLGRATAAIGSALAIAVAFGCGAAGGSNAKQAVSPCGTANAPAWSPDGTQIAWCYRWPHPPQPRGRQLQHPARDLRLGCRREEPPQTPEHGLQRALHQRPERGSRASSKWKQPNLLLAGMDHRDSHGPARREAEAPRQDRPDPVLHGRERRSRRQRVVRRRLPDVRRAGQSLERPARRRRGQCRRHEGRQLRPEPFARRDAGGLLAYAGQGQRSGAR